jgi:hypothetical protein
MSSPETQQTERSEAVQEQAVAPVVQIRIDAPHDEAMQLARELATRQEDLDRRQAQVNAQIAQLERSQRAARLRLHEQQAELDGREEELDRAQAGSESRATASDEETVAEPADTGERGRQLYTEAAQLARELAVRQEELDRRQAQVNAQAAQLEQNQRSALLWLREQQAELGSRRDEVELARRETLVRLDRLAATEAAVLRKTTTREEELTAREESIRRREAELASRDKLLADQVAAHRLARRAFESEQGQAVAKLDFLKQQVDVRREASLVLVQQLLSGVERRRLAVEAEAEECQRRALRTPHAAGVATADEETLQARRREIEASEARLVQAQADTERLRRQLLDQQQQFQEAMRAERSQLAAQQRRGLAEVEEKRLAAQRRSEHVDQCRTALEQLRAELGQIHRETLEIRLATEELWAQLSGVAPPAALTQMLGKTRARLADDYRMANDDLRRQREELEGIRGELAEHHEKLVQQKRQLDQWAQRRQQQIEQNAERLVAREQELDHQETALKRLAQQWQVERIESQREIRGLRVKLADLEEVTPLA